MQSRDFHQDGIKFYKALRTLYKTQLSSYEIRIKHGAFGVSKINPNKSIDEFAARLLMEKRALEEESIFEK